MYVHCTYYAVKNAMLPSLANQDVKEQATAEEAWNDDKLEMMREDEVSAKIEAKERDDRDQEDQIEAQDQQDQTQDNESK